MDTKVDRSPAPEIACARLIDERRIELCWSTQVRRADDERNFSVMRDGEELELVHWTADMGWDYGCVYQKETCCTTLALLAPVDVADAAQISVRVRGEVCDLLARPADCTRRYNLEYQPHYTTNRSTRDGIKIKGSKVIQSYTLEIAAQIIDLMLEKRCDIASKLKERGAEVAVYGLKYDAYDVPEHRMGYLMATRPVEGFGGEAENAISSISEANLIRLRTGRYATRYPNEMILVHEFGHAIHLVGINFLEDQTCADQVRSAYRGACERNLWPDSYAISNYEEYFATLSTVWFDAMQEGIDGTWDGIRGPVNTRDELEQYDPSGYELMKSIYPEKSLPRPWRFGKDDYDINGRPRVYDLDTKFDWEFIG
ncbi:hypothetical protein Corgl_0095 [Coriobacterium glomerans PW2]|uniref:Uncharacterized protein n=1 Tax=Coriobacterium glomerans (strain ATCC 49209 / DSM 20642 / JCM 10262 / PW2) TaxID=700015 RepID=F2N9W8_CORGP|nr:hypothetical protein [Coriobacterium glomerans]AEB06223.1 hypothetical protein Corgl_0095 [Coriobacterium glomerans PW2]